MERPHSCRHGEPTTGLGRKLTHAESPRLDPLPRSYAQRRSQPDVERGPPIVGFGDDIPAFMLIRKRGPLSQVLEMEESDDDVTNEEMTETTNDADMAA